MSAEIMLSATEPEPADFADLRASCQATLRWIQSSASRAAQQNRAAMQSESAWLWFLHADSRLAPNCFAAIEQARPNALNYFRIRFYDGPVWMRINEFGVNLRCWLFKLPFGDQGFLLRRASWLALGEFPEQDVPTLGGEDVALVKCARKTRIAIAALPAVIGTSARKYIEQGWLRTTLSHLRATWRQTRENRSAYHAR
jgi:hypothetical protein